MTREDTSSADRELLGLLHDRDLAVSAAQLERWRRAGLLPRHARGALGRGRGSTSVLRPSTVEVADVLTRCSGQGKDLRATVLAWYMRAGTPGGNTREPVPEPPFDAVRDALVWALRRDPVRRLIEQAHQVRNDGDADDLYTAADKFLARSPGLLGHPGRMREALLSSTEDFQPPPRGGQRNLVHLIAAIGLPPGEVDAGTYAHAMAGTGMFPETDPVLLVQIYERAQQDGTWDSVRHHDAVAQATSVTADDLARARDVARTLGLCGGLYLFHGMLLPDTPGQQAIRVRIDTLGMGEFFIALPHMLTKIDAAGLLIMCLDPVYDQ
ncbi:hypothetical protein ACFWAX_41330, partial [Streptomyces sp. NPDC059956]